MDIAVQSDTNIGMPQNLTEAFHIKSYLDASGSKSVAKRMEMGISDTASFRDRFEMVLHRTRLNIFVFVSGQHISFLYSLLH